MKSLRSIMLAGTGSDVGKSILATGLCRIFRQDGYHPAPFKAQNMALNSYATPDGLEIGLAQAIQAEAAEIPCSTDMNPLLLKPSGDCTSQVVLNGIPIGNQTAYAYFRREGREELRGEVHKAYDRLASRFNPIVMEGAGSIAELNLRDSDLVNMSMAAYADADVILVADIDRGGVFASAYGSIMLQPEEDRKRIKGIIVNKFRGDIRLFEEGRRILERTCGVPVLGVVPYLRDIHIDEEDSVSLEKKSHRPVAGKINIAVVHLRHISNFTDFYALEKMNRAHVYFSENPQDIAAADIIIIPGSKSTIDDLETLKSLGIADVILCAHNQGKMIIGICGGYQMLGMKVYDPHGVESDTIAVDGIGLLPISTTLTKKKVTRQTEFNFLDSADTCFGYEIHMGQTRIIDSSDVRAVNRLMDGTLDGCLHGKNCIGTYIHGFFDNKAVVRYLLAPFITEEMEIEDYRTFKNQQYDRLADALRESLDMDMLYKIMGRDD